MGVLDLGRRAAPRVLVLACVLSTAWCHRAFALDTALDAGQYAHTAWRIREGFAPGTIGAIAQTPDGYLWLGTVAGLLRFDGVRAVPWQPPDGKPLPESWVRSLIGTRDGALFVGMFKGLVSFKGGERTSYPELATLLVNSLIEDRDGTVWVGAQASPEGGHLCAIRRGAARCETQDGDFGRYIAALHEDQSGRLWVASSAGILRHGSASADRFAVPGLVGDSIQAMAEGDDGELVIAAGNGMLRFVDGRFAPYPVPGVSGPSPVLRLVRDRDGGLWIGTRQQGLIHVHEGRMDTFGRSDGLSGESVATMFEDREGNIWVSTLDGLDRFRALPAATLTRAQGLAASTVASVLVGDSGDLWINSLSGLNRWEGGKVGEYTDRDGPKRAGSMFEDSRGRLWIGALDALGYFESDRFVRVAGSLGRLTLVDSFAEDGAGNIWIAHREQGLLRRSVEGATQAIPWTEISRAAKLGREDSGFRLAVDRRRGGLWIGFRFGGLAYFADGAVRESYSAAEALPQGQVRHVRVDDAGVVWAATEGGIARLEAGRIATLSSRNGLPCDTVDWMIDDDADSVWLYLACGIARIARADLDAWVVAAKRDEPDAQPIVQATVFGSSDGVRSVASIGSYTPHVAKTRDGKLWFVTDDGITVLDPANLRRNMLPPPVQIEQIVADRTAYDVAAATGSVQLPPIVRDVQIDYTALSLIAPEKMQFRYQLKGRDDGWQDAGTRRQAFYTDLPPGDYLFRVIASNNDGGWNEEGASLAFTIAPTFYQTRSFAALSVAAAAGILWLLYALRVRRIETRMAMRLEERLAERERIARDLHDTFLQSVQGLMLKFQAVMTRMPDDAPSRVLLERALDRADEVLAEGRDRVYELRASTDATPDLPQALTAVAAELTPVAPTEFRVVVHGKPRPLHPVVREEAYSIGAEALRNAFRHAAARHIDLEIEYARQGLSVRVADDGSGFDVTALTHDTPGKHFGLTGLRERARKIRSQLEVSSRPGSGTEVQLDVPAVVAYAPDRRTKTLAG